MDEILQSVRMLAQDQFGNYVVQVCCNTFWFFCLLSHWLQLVILFSACSHLSRVLMPSIILSNCPIGIIINK